MKNIKRGLLLIIILLLLVGCKKKEDDVIEVRDPNVEYKSSYDGSYGSTGPLQGNTVVVSIFTNDESTRWEDSNSDKKAINTVLDKLSSATQFLKESAAAYGKNATFVYNWETYNDLRYTANFSQNLVIQTGDYYSTQKAWIEKNINSKALKNKYQADNIVYLFFINTEFSNNVKPWTITHNNCSYCDIEFSNIFYRFEGIATPASTIAHEMLHQYGAPDLYVANNYINQRYVDHLASNGSKDIMFYINKGVQIESKFTEIDAYYVGIGKRPSEADTWALGKSEYERG